MAEHGPSEAREAPLDAAARVLNDNYLAGTQGARWHELEPSEQEYWKTACQAVIVAAFSAMGFFTESSSPDREEGS